MNIVVLDEGCLPEGAEFPFLEAPKYGWVERLQVAEEEMAEVAWRAHILVTVNTPVRAAVIDQLPLLKMVVIMKDCADNSCDLVDMEAANAREIQVAHVPDGAIDGVENSTASCAEVVRIIDAMIVGKPTNLLFR